MEKPRVCLHGNLAPVILHRIDLETCPRGTSHWKHSRANWRSLQRDPELAIRTPGRQHHQPLAGVDGSPEHAGVLRVKGPCQLLRPKPDEVGVGHSHRAQWNRSAGHRNLVLALKSFCPNPGGRKALAPVLLLVPFALPGDVEPGHGEAKCGCGGQGVDEPMQRDGQVPGPTLRALASRTPWDTSRKIGLKVHSVWKVQGHPLLVASLSHGQAIAEHLEIRLGVLIRVATDWCSILGDLEGRRPSLNDQWLRLAVVHN
mmetsp:Transcript_33462/g.80270  ORF Transcript_33462/g.80270 Transcript_33462/m.80270 type:complete len:258 (-) Transcript_33462:246-1019(-)